MQNNNNKIQTILSILAKQTPSPQTELHYSNPFELLVAVILSAQCTDKRVNMVTPSLFKAFPTASAMAQASVEDIYEKIKSVSYPNNKSQNLKKMSQILIENFGGQTPDNIEALETLPGVGRKTASVVVSVLYNKPAMPVDTHVFRVSNRLGIVNAKNVREAEKQLLALIPEDLLHNAHHWLILHGRYVCKARSPKCSECSLKDYCDYFKKIANRA
jgi:endonuclease-3